MKNLWKGQYLDGKTSASRKAEIRPSKEGLRIKLARGRERVWPYGEIRQAQGRYAGEPVRLERGQDIPETLIVPDTDFLVSLRSQARGKSGRFHDPGFRKTRLWLTLYAALATLGTAFAAYRWGIPALAQAVTAKVPVSWEEKLGLSTLDQLAPIETRLHSPGLDQGLDAIVAKLTAPLGKSGYHFRVTVSDEPIVNAFALPGGNIVVFRGLLEETARPEELAGVLAHEMQHVLKRHTTHRLIQESSTGLLISALSGDFTGSMAFGVKSAGTLALMQYDREEEAEADREGMKMILAAGIDPQGMIDFFVKLKDKGKMPRFLKYVSNHPATEDRIAKLREMVAAQPLPKTEKLLPETDWPQLVKGLGSATVGDPPQKEMDHESH